MLSAVSWKVGCSGDSSEGELCGVLDSMALQWTATGGPVGTDGGHNASGCDGQCEEFVYDAQNQFHPVGHREFPVQAFAVSVDRMRRNPEIGGDGEFSVIVEHVM